MVKNFKQTADKTRQRSRRGEVVAGIVTVIFLAVSGLLIATAFHPDSKNWVEATIAENQALLPVFIFVFRYVATAFPPVSGSWIALGSIPYLGWEIAALIDGIAGLAGLATSYFLVRKYGENLVKRYVPVERIQYYREQLTRRQQFMVIFALRVFGSMVFDFINYAISLSMVSPLTYFAALIPATVVSQVIVFSLFSLGFSEDNPLLFLLILIPLVGGGFLLRKFSNSP